MTDIEERIRKTLYYGHSTCELAVPSLPLTKMAVELSRGVTARKLGYIDLEEAANIGQKASVMPCQMLLSLLYMKRLRKSASTDYLQNVTSSDVFLLSVMMASKYLCDNGSDEEIFNDEWAEIADRELEEINNAEMSFLKNIDWNLYVSEVEFQQVLMNVEKRIAESEAVYRGWYTYTDISVLSDPHLVAIYFDHLREAVKVVVVCCVAYAVGVLTLACAARLPSLLRLHSVDSPLRSPPSHALRCGASTKEPSRNNESVINDKLPPGDDDLSEDDLQNLSLCPSLPPSATFHSSVMWGVAEGGQLSISYRRDTLTNRGSTADCFNNSYVDHRSREHCDLLYRSCTSRYLGYRGDGNNRVFHRCLLA